MMYNFYYLPPSAMSSSLSISSSISHLEYTLQKERQKSLHMLKEHFCQDDCFSWKSVAKGRHMLLYSCYNISLYWWILSFKQC